MKCLDTIIALVDYIEVFPQRQYHRNAKITSNNSTYVKTNEKVLNKLKESLKHQTMKPVERQFNKITSNDFEKRNLI